MPTRSSDITGIDEDVNTNTPEDISQDEDQKISPAEIRQDMRSRQELMSFVADELSKSSTSASITSLDIAATAALTGMLAHPQRYKPRLEGQNWHDAIATEAYQIAQAMERAKNRL